LAQIDPETLRVVQTIRVGNGPGGVAAGEGAVWVANTFDGTVSEIDLRRGAVTKTIPVGLRPTGIAVGARVVWVTDELNGIVLRIDPRSRRVVSGISVGNGPTSVAVSEGRAWVANRQDGTVSRIDTSTNSVSAATPVGAGPSSVATGSGKVWVASEGDGTIARLEARTGRVDKTLSLDSSPHALAVSGGNIWVAALPSLASHRGGVLRVESEPSTCRCTDPAFQTEAFSFTDQSVFTLAHDGLVAYRRVGGIAGGALVGDLANDVPAPTDHGRTYTFQLRKDLRYANGAPVRASDVRYSLERVLTVNRAYALGYYKGIVGATRCAARPPKRCDLSRGIDVDDRAGSITIHLTEADSDFVHKLTFPLAFVVPTGTPLRLGRERNTPGTGPYRVASFAPDRAVRLVRNPYFRVWSQDARPDGYPDEIRFHLGEDYAASLTAVEKGSADWTQVVTSALPAGSVQGLLTRDTGRLHSDPLPVTFWTFMNTRVPPFDDVRVRRALNYAIDRTVLEQIGGGVLRAPAACQILPPGFPGYRPYCPYTLHPNPAGTWTAPDLAKARALVSASGTRGMRVEAVIFHSTTGGVERSFQYVVSVLRRLGYRSSLRVLPTRGPGAFTAYGDYVADSRNRVQIGFSGWLAGTLAASDFLRLFSCAAFRPESTANENTSEFCVRGIDAQMRRSAALQTSDPARANELWAGVDRALVDRVAVAPTLGGRNLVLVSERVGNYQNHPLWGALLDQLWVK
jgi:peptide/nickel transport system substrate-binding protein